LTVGRSAAAALGPGYASTETGALRADCRSMSNRARHLLDELTVRYDLQPEFVARLAPTVEQILAPALSEDQRITLLELLAETCDRDQRLRRDFGAIREGLASLARRLAGH
jgi:hypothetical protein